MAPCTAATTTTAVVQVDALSTVQTYSIEHSEVSQHPHGQKVDVRVEGQEGGQSLEQISTRHQTVIG